MKTINLRLAFAVAALALSIINAEAQNFTLLHAFQKVSGSPATNVEGGEPVGALVLLGNTLYGTAAFYGTNGYGTMFSVSTDSTGFNVLHTFTTNEGINPNAGSVVDGPVFYWTASGGGTNLSGTVFSVVTNGTGLTVVHSFAAANYNAPLPEGELTNFDGSSPVPGLVLSAGTLYGVTANGGSNASGAVFSVNTNGTGIHVLHTFAQAGSPGIGLATNSDGVQPDSGLVLSGNTLFGVTFKGGTNDYGTLFSVNRDGTGFSLLHTFPAFPGDGEEPNGLVIAGNQLYGTTQAGGTNGWGSVFSVQTNGSNFTLLHSFTKGQYVPSLIGDTNADGAGPEQGAVILSGSTLYGTTTDGGTNGAGTVFSINTDGSGFTVLHTMAAVHSGIWPEGRFPDSLALSGNTLYGACGSGGPNDTGTIFALMVPGAGPPPQIGFVPPAPGSAMLMISWPNTATGFVLESNADLNNALSWQPFGGSVIDSNGQQTVQINTTGSQSFFRLRHP
jgi:uncharacterized repeat protein (TIGR03803 family)